MNNNLQELAAKRMAEIRFPNTSEGDYVADRNAFVEGYIAALSPQPNNDAGAGLMAIAMELAITSNATERHDEEGFLLGFDLDKVASACTCIAQSYADKQVAVFKTKAEQMNKAINLAVYAMQLAIDKAILGYTARKAIVTAMADCLILKEAADERASPRTIPPIK